MLDVKNWSDTYIEAVSLRMRLWVQFSFTSYCAWMVKNTITPKWTSCGVFMSIQLVMSQEKVNSWCKPDMYLPGLSKGSFK